jgi:predicted dehydrogenase
MNVAVIGCGLIGRKRTLALDKDDSLTACCDVRKEAAEAFSKEFSCPFYTDPSKLIAEVDCDAIVVAVVNKYMKDIVIDALRSGRHALAEKPLGRNAAEAREMVEAQKNSEFRIQGSELKDRESQFGVRNSEFRTPVPDSLATNPETRSPIPENGISIPKNGISILKTGFNHRFHPHLWKAKEILDSGGIGKAFNIRARYGHGGRPGMEKEWRCSKDLCGGGELLDQGVHVIDLIRWFGGDVSEVTGKVETAFWPIEVEDNAFAILKTVQGVIASFHVSWTNWRNMFSFEVFGTDGYLKIEGLGGHYGPETLEYGRRKKEGGRPDIETFEFAPEDVSWKYEWREFKSAVHEKREPIGSGLDGLKANEVVEALYQSSEKRNVVVL